MGNAFNRNNQDKATNSSHTKQGNEGAQKSIDDERSAKSNTESNAARDHWTVTTAHKVDGDNPAPGHAFPVSETITIKMDDKEVVIVGSNPDGQLYVPKTERVTSDGKLIEKAGYADLAEQLRSAAVPKESQAAVTRACSILNAPQDDEE